MATVKMGQIKTTLAKSLAYISRPDATNEGMWVSTNTAVIDPKDFKAVAAEFMRTKDEAGASGRSGVLAHHLIQSFDPKDQMSVELAHQIGVQLAEKVTGGGHEYMIATHLDKGHIHNHIIFNSTNRETGRKFRVVKSTMRKVRSLSDALCVQNGLSVLPEPARASGRSMADIYRTLRGRSARQFLRTEIDRASARATSWDEFQAILARTGIEVSQRGGRNGTLSFREMSMGRPVRDWRLGEAYTEKSIMARLARATVNEIGVDTSMIVKESVDTLTVTVPGTRRQLELTVAKRHVVRHGRALRIYIPSEQQHMLAGRDGKLAKTVDTAGLYKWFSEPDRSRLERYAKVKQVDIGTLNTGFDKLSGLRQLEQDLNAKARWVTRAGGDLSQAIRDAQTFVTERRESYQQMLVAATELTGGSRREVTELRRLEVLMTVTETEIDRARIDLAALARITPQQITQPTTRDAGSKRENTGQRSARDFLDAARAARTKASTEDQRHNDERRKRRGR